MAPRKRETAAQAPVSRQKTLSIAASALDKKAEDMNVLEVGRLVTYTDFFVICSGRSSQHVKAIVDQVEETMREQGIRADGVEGRSNAKWVLMDYGDVIVHVFDMPTREFYELDKLWLDAPRIRVDEDTLDTGGKDKRALGV